LKSCRLHVSISVTRPMGLLAQGASPAQMARLDVLSVGELREEIKKLGGKPALGGKGAQKAALLALIKVVIFTTCELFFSALSPFLRSRRRQKKLSSRRQRWRTSRPRRWSQQTNPHRPGFSPNSRMASTMPGNITCRRGVALGSDLSAVSRRVCGQNPWGADTAHPA
jgi:hypothetical protein